MRLYYRNIGKIDMEAIEINHHRLPVTALDFYGDHLLLAGEGSWLDVFDTQTEKCVGKYKIFKAAVIHGLRINIDCEDAPICIFGGKSFRVLEQMRSLDFVQNGDEIELNDWIQDVCWLTEETDWKFGIVMSHNFVILYDHNKKTKLQEVHCEDKCIIYSGLLLGSSWRNLVLAAGTVFNQVVIWALEGQRSKEGQAEVLHRLEGHKGVIFSMDFNRERKILCSVSDDRSLRLWQMVLPPGVDTSEQLDWESAKFEPLLELYGHAARVWDCKLLDDHIVSVGEDACCILWDYNGTLLNKFKGHKGKSIWSLATHPSGLLATGGGDCGIRLYNFKSRNEESKVMSRSLVPPEVTTGQKFFPRTVKLLGCNNILIMTDEGILYQNDVITGDWTILFQSDLYKSYCVLEVLTSRDLVALGGVHGNLVILHAELKTDFKIFDGKVHSVCWLDSGNSSTALCLLLSGPNGLMKLYTVEVTKDEIRLEHHSSYRLPPAKQCWTTCALLVEDDELLVCGDRSGSIHVYRIHESEPKQKFSKVHGSSGVTDMCYYEGHLWSGGRDGQIKEFNVTEEGQVDLLHSNKVLKGLQWISKLYFSDEDQLVLGFHTNNFVAYSLLQQQVVITIPCGGGHRAWDCNFTNKHQMAFFYIKSREVIRCQATIEDHVTIIQPSLHGREVTAIATIFSGDQPVIASGSEDTTVNLLQMNSQNDTFKILHTLTAHISSVRTICVVPSVIKSSASAKNEGQLMFTAGGRAQIIAWRITQKCDSLNDNTSSKQDGASALETEKKSVQYEHLKTYSLVHKGRMKSRQSNLDPETRIMSVTAFPLYDVLENDDVQHTYVVACGCSDGLLRVYLFDEGKPSFQLMFQSDFHDHCLLRVGHVIMGPTNHRTTYIYSSATDGRVAFWNTTGIISKILKAPAENVAVEDVLALEEEGGLDAVCLSYTLILHQSGINAVALQILSDEEFLLAAGGDDNCLAVAKIKLIDNGNFDVVWTLKELNAHATEITGIQFCLDKTVVTASIDQRVTLWSINEDHQKIEFQVSKFLNVADISDLQLLNRGLHNHFVVSGQGLQTFSLSI